MVMAAPKVNSVTRAINGEIGTAIARGMMYLSVPAIGLMGFLIHDWVTTPVNALSNRVVVLEQVVPALANAQHMDEVTIGTMQSSISLGRADRIAQGEDTKAAISTLSAKTDQLQTSIGALSASVAGVVATLDVLKDQHVATNRP